MQNRDIRNEPNKGVKDPGKQINHLKNGLAEEVPQRQDLEEALEKALDELERLKQEYAQGKENYTLLLENTHDIIYAVEVIEHLYNDIEYVIVGIGINANMTLNEFPKPLQVTATTLQECLQRPIDMPRLFSYLIGQLEFWYIRLCDQGFKAISPHYRRICMTLGKQVAIELEDVQVKGLAKDIGPDGSLVLEMASGRQLIRSGDVISATHIEGDK